MYEEALAALTEYFNVLDRPGIAEALTRGNAEAGYLGAMNLAAETMAEQYGTTYSSPSDVALLYLWAGKNEQALEWLERAFEARGPNIPYIGVNPGFDGLHHESRYQDLLRRVKFPEDVIARILEGNP